MQLDHDVVLVGAGFSGLYAAHKFRDELGLSVKGFESGQGPGGTWYWNRYPGARCDFESVHYSYSFSPDIQREWEWSERFAAQPEILAYLEWVADKLDVRREFQFNTRVTETTWNDAESYWTVVTADGASCAARFLVSCAGVLSVPKKPEFPGADTFKGQVLWTSSWPQEPVDFAGKRVAVIGTGSTGIQVIPEIAKDAAHLTVFQRTANFAAPLGNAPVEQAQRRWNADNHEEVRAHTRERFIGAPYEPARLPAMGVSAEERRQIYDTYWERGGFPFLVSTFTDLLFDKGANDTICDYIRDRIRQRVDDPATADLLCPDDHPYASKRPPFETNYYETYNLPHVDLVDVRPAPIESITPTGIKTSAASYEFDIIVLATGFISFTAPVLNLGVTGRDGVRLEDKWADGPTSYLGLQVEGFPNFFTIIGPQSAAALYNAPLAIEDHVDLTAAMIARVQRDDGLVIEPTLEAERTWGALTEGLLNLTLIPQSKGSWYMGENIPGRPRAAYLFASGAPFYRAICAEVEAGDYAGFAIDGVSTPLPPLVRVAPSVGMSLVGMLNQGAKPIDQCSLEEARAMTESLATMQLPGPDVRVESVDQPAARIYVPEGEGPFPVVVFFHSGGWSAGSLDLADAPCRRLAVELGAVVVSAGYRLAPEHPFPAATDDTFAALQWAQSNVSDYGGDPDRMVVMGESAGANLAAVAAIRARDAGIELAGQILINPPIDPESVTFSREEFVNGPFISAAAGEMMWAAYLGGAEITALAAPSRSESLEGVAPALILTVELDLVRDEAEDYGRALAAAGVPVEQQRFDGLIHPAFNMSAFVPEVQDMYDRVNDFFASRVAKVNTSR